jgi:Kdo2-lipid IVA lauroyltransferase/acyltransferase
VSASPRSAVTPGGPLASALAALLLGVLRALPASARTALARLVARCAWLLAIRRQVTLDNLGRAFPEKPEAERLQIARQAYANMALAAVESICSDLIPDAQLQTAVDAGNTGSWATLQALLLSRQPVLIASAHFGSWELFAEVMARRKFAFSAVVRPLAGAFNARVVAAREKAGVELILQRGAMRGIFAALKQGRAVVQLIDQSLPAKHGVFVPFFGQPASTTPSLSLAALRTGAPVYVVLAPREGKNLKMIVEGPIPLPNTGNRDADLTAHTATLTAIIERAIREHPDQWLWLHRRWKVKPP